MGQLLKKVKVSYRIKLLSGLHIGGSRENVEIGGVDSPVIKTMDGVPYIPGSSLRGKMRCLLEQIYGASKVEDNGEVNELFGTGGEKAIHSRLIVRDAYLQDEDKKRLEDSDSLDLVYTEIKYENSIDRVKGTANNPRQIERVPAGVSFMAEFVINIWKGDNEIKLMDLFERGVKAIQNDYLGGSGSRGYGQVVFERIGDPEEIVFEIE